MPRIVNQKRSPGGDFARLTGNSELIPRRPDRAHNFQFADNQSGIGPRRGEETSLFKWSKAVSSTVSESFADCHHLEFTS